ncbi:MAG: iron donor protein CyaY [Zoogloeaceae bacterium]|nr:iron donor protein CyaY [Rhodocyclaceae bacterium]MCP5238130.1 iron donor protein CyaY [Zoogloeaceae bacterium]
MDEREFGRLADDEMARIEAALEACDGDFDVDLQPGGVIEIEFDDGSKVVINRHSAAREIWLAARSGGYHFAPRDGRWIAGRDGAELYAVLARVIGEQSGTPVRLSGD